VAAYGQFFMAVNNRGQIREEQGQKWVFAAINDARRVPILDPGLRLGQRLGIHQLGTAVMARAGKLTFPGPVREQE
jgi:hypothetical protein